MTPYYAEKIFMKRNQRSFYNLHGYKKIKKSFMKKIKNTFSNLIKSIKSNKIKNQIEKENQNYYLRVISLANKIKKMKEEIKEAEYKYNQKESTVFTLRSNKTNLYKKILFLEYNLKNAESSMNKILSDLSNKDLSEQEKLIIMSQVYNITGIRIHKTEPKHMKINNKETEKASMPKHFKQKPAHMKDFTQIEEKIDSSKHFNTQAKINYLEELKKELLDYVDYEPVGKHFKR